MPDRADATGHLLRRIRLRLFAVTFGLVALLVVGVGTATAVAGLAALDADVDRALEVAVTAAAARAPREAGGESGEVDDIELASADTFVLYLDGEGGVIANPSRKKLVGLPNLAAVEAVRAGAAGDWRTVVVDSRSVRLLTVPLGSGANGAAAFVQGGFALTLHDAQSRSLVATIVGAGAAGLLAAAVVTALVTRRALVPIRRALDTQRRFVADASHELRTPIAIIHADAEILEREGHVDPGGAVLAADIVEESGRLGRLVGDLLTLAAAESQGMTLRLEQVDLAALTQETSRRLEPLATDHRVAIKTTSPGAVPIEGDRDRLIQVLLILLDNAVHHAPPDSDIEVSVVRGPSAVEVAVRDHGRGVPEADRSRVFEPFTRSATAAGERTRGSGLGLAIASAIVAAHRGSIRIEDAAGGGARFVVSLPAAS